MRRIHLAPSSWYHHPDADHPTLTPPGWSAGSRVVACSGRRDLWATGAVNSAKGRCRSTASRPVPPPDIPGGAAHLPTPIPPAANASARPRLSSCQVPHQALSTSPAQQPVVTPTRPPESHAPRRQHRRCLPPPPDAGAPPATPSLEAVWPFKLSPHRQASRVTKYGWTRSGSTNCVRRTSTHSARTGGRSHDNVVVSRANRHPPSTKICSASTKGSR